MESNARSNTNTLSTSGMSQNSDGLLNKATSGAHHAVNSVANAADEVARKTLPAIDGAAGMAHHAVDIAVDAVAPTANWLAKRGGQLKAKQKQVLSDTSTYIADHPFKSLAIALAAGYLISHVTRK